MTSSRPIRSSQALKTALLTLFLAGCSTSGGRTPAARPPTPDSLPTQAQIPVPEDTVAPAVDTLWVAEDTIPHQVPSEPDPVVWDSWADSVLASLSLEEKAGQLIMPWVLGDYAPVGSSSFRRIAAMVEDMGVGGIIMSVGSPSEVALKVNDLQRRASLPLLVAADLETGAGFRMRGAVYLPGAIDLGGATQFPPLMALGATQDRNLAYEMGMVTAREARAVGIHVPFAPVLDVNNNPDNPIINIRSFGEDPMEVARLGTAFIRGVQEHGAVATGKHFPGHGDTGTDSHLALPVIRVPRERLDSVELTPFQHAINEGMGGIMTAHISVPALNGGAGLPATLSDRVLTSLLKDQMGFDGIVFTDAMDMSAIDRRYGRGPAAVRAVNAGADVILMPPDVRAAIRGLVEGVENGDLPEERLNASVLKVLRMKEKMGLHLRREVPLERINRTVGVPAHVEVAQRIADRSLTLLKNEGDLIPLRGTRSARVLSVSYRRSSDLLAGRFMNAGLRQRYPRLVTANLDRSTPPEVYDGLIRRASTSSLVVVSLYVTVVTASGSVAVPDEVVEFIQSLADNDVPHVVVSFGNPYLLTEFPDAQAYLLAWGGAEVSQRAAARGLFGDIGITGRVPTRIPPLFEIGAGITIPAKESDGGS